MISTVSRRSAGRGDDRLPAPEPRLAVHDLVVGGEWYIHPSIRVGPNVELVKYDHDPAPVNLPRQDETRLYRLTFFWTF